jgi:hypothetical protein
MRRFPFALFAFLVVLSARPLVASTFYVGTCKVAAFGDIQTAVNTVPAGSIIDICPGNYAQQIVISKAVTLQGIFSSNSALAEIDMPSGGLTTTSSINPYLNGTVAAQVEVTVPGVNLINLTVNGTATSSNCPATTLAYIGIFYSSGSSGTLNKVQTRNQNCNGLGVGIAAENGAGAAQAVTIESSDVNNVSYTGIFAYSNQSPPTLTALIKGNYISAYDGVQSFDVAGSVSGNNIFPSFLGMTAASPSSTTSGNQVTGGTYGFAVEAPGAVVSGNTVNNAPYGVLVDFPGSVTSNHISNSGTAAIFLTTNGATIKTNTITQVLVGVEFNCHSATTSGNTINGATWGLHTVPSAFSGVNTFYNVLAVRTGGAC